MKEEEILNKMREGSWLTLCRGTSAHLDKYTKKETKVDFNIARNLTYTSKIECWGGNQHTGDRHFVYKLTNTSAIKEKRAKT